jgi:hypothetical protein
VWGSYEYMMEKQGHWNYLVAGSLVLTSLGALLPIAAEYARREGMHGLKWAAWLAIPLALAFVLTVSIQRTGSVTDLDEVGRQQIAAAIVIAKTEQGEAEQQLVTDQQMVASNCDVIGPKCKAAMDARAATEAKLASARAVLKKRGIAVDDSMAKRLIAWFPFLTKEQVQLYQPMLLPMGLAFFGSLMIAIGAAGGHELAPASAPVSEEPELDGPAPARPRLVVVNQPTGSVPKALMEILKPVQGKRVEIADAYRGYATRCRNMGVVPASTVRFAELVRETGIKTRMIKDLVYLLNVQLVSPMSKVSENRG